MKADSKARMTFADRLAVLRKTKIEHTIQKTKVNGYMDGDDYGTVPLPTGYSFKPIYDDGEDFFYGDKGNAQNFKRFLENHPLYIDRMEILAGRWADMMPGYRRADRAYAKYYPFDDLKPLQRFYNINSGIGADAHCACDYQIGLKLGFGGILNKIRLYSEKNGESKRTFYDAEEMVVIAIQDFIRRHIKKAEQMYSVEESPEIAETLQEMISANTSIVEGKPETFLEACQWIAWFNTVSRMYDRDGAGCNIDVLLYPYYENDINNGSLNNEKAKFILANLLLNDPHYYQLSGADRDDCDMTNPLSFLILDAAHMLNTSVNLTVRLHDNIDKELVKKAVFYLFNDRNGWPRFSGDRGLMNFMKNEGVTKADARKRIAVGCNWMAIPGCEYPINDCVKINAARVFEVAFTDMQKEANPSVALLLALLEALSGRQT